MSCARIRNKPVKFMDPQEMIILDLKQEIKRLKVENKKLRANMLSAPTSTSNTVHRGGFSDDEGSPSRLERAHSAQSNRTLDKLGVRPNKKKTTDKGFLPPIKASSKRTAKSEILSKYPQLQKILKKEEVQSLTGKNEFSRSTERLRPQFKSVVTNPETKSVFDDEPSSVLTAEQQSPKKRMSVEALDELVHRRAPGPLIFKDNADSILGVREGNSNKYYPADNYVRHMDHQAQMLKSESSLPLPEKSNAKNVVSAEDLIVAQRNGAKTKSMNDSLAVILVSFLIFS
jgi:hypothetical protein